MRRVSFIAVDDLHVGCSKISALTIQARTPTVVYPHQTQLIHCDMMHACIT